MTSTRKSGACSQFTLRRMGREYGLDAFGPAHQRDLALLLHGGWHGP